MIWNQNIFTVRDLLEMLTRLPVYPNDRLRQKLEQGSPERELALEICADLAIEYDRLNTARREASDSLSQAKESASKLMALLEHERETHRQTITQLETNISELSALVNRQQQMINRRFDENTK